MQGVYLKFFVQEHRKLHGRLAYEWLLEKGKALGFPGGSALRAVAGFGRHGVLHEDHFFELAGSLPVVVEFVVSEADAQRMLELVAAEKQSFFYVKVPVEYGVTNGAAPGGEA